MSGALRLFTWSRAADDLSEAHAFRDAPGFVFSSVCDLERWTVKRLPATRGPLCPVCRSIVKAAALRTLDEIVDLEAVGRPLDRLTGIEQHQAESR